MKDLDLTRFDLNLLVVFEALWRERHVGRAADQLHLSQSATSHALSRMRDAFGDQLFIRNPKGVEPTPLAVELAARVTDILVAVREVATPRGPFNPATLKAEVNIAATDYSVSTVIAPCLRHIQEQAPGIVLKIAPANQDSVIQQLDSGEVDLAIASGSFANAPARIISELLFKERFVGIARSGHPALIKRGGKFRMELANFVAFPHVLVSPRGDVRGPVDTALEQHGLKRFVKATCPSFLAVPSLVGGSDSLAVIAERTAHQLSSAFGTVRFELPIALPTWELNAAYASGRAEESGIQWLCSVFRNSTAAHG